LINPATPQLIDSQIITTPEYDIDGVMREQVYASGKNIPYSKMPGTPIYETN
jgi:hypothetical protein